MKRVWILILFALAGCGKQTNDFVTGYEMRHCQSMCWSHSGVYGWSYADQSPCFCADGRKFNRKELGTE